MQFTLVLVLTVTVSAYVVRLVNRVAPVGQAPRPVLSAARSAGLFVLVATAVLVGLYLLIGLLWQVH